MFGKRKLLVSLNAILLLITFTMMGYVFGISKYQPNTVKVSDDDARSELATPQVLAEFKQRLRIWRTVSDLRPRVLHAWPGKALIEVVNDRGDQASIRIDRITPDASHPTETLDLAPQLRRTKHEITLGSGEYIIYDTTQPAMRVRLVVEPRH
jgi:hypothetical protein